MSTRGPRATSERLRRLLVMLPWLMERGEVPVAEMAERFHVDEKHLIADLERAALCGLPPYVDEMIDLYIDDGVIHAGVPRLFTRPLRLTPEEGFSLLAAGRAALELPGSEPDGPLARALAKLEAALGARSVVAVELEHPPFLDAVRAAVDAGRRLAVTYYSAWRDELTARRIDPQAVFSERGDWYVVADDVDSGAERTFRVDRFESVVETGDGSVRREVVRGLAGWLDSSAERQVTLRLEPVAAWVVERYPTTTVEHDTDGRLIVTLPVVGDHWLARLLVRLGPAATVVDPPEAGDVARAAARRALARYG
jgi:proteasome accessory factor C